MFNPKMLELARKTRGIAKTILSEKLNLSIQTLSDWELGKTIPKLENLLEVSKILNFPISFFYIESPNFDNLHISFRALTKMKAVDRDKAISSAKLAILLNSWFEKYYNLPKLDLPQFINLSPEECAIQVRKLWNLDDCINNTINILEKHGVRVYSLIENCKDYDALSTWYDNIPYVFLNTKKTAERCRFDAMHELGHLIMHKGKNNKDRTMEDEANRFASEMLMPKESVLKYCKNNININFFIQQKVLWKVSLKALIYRCNKLGLISDWIFRSLCIQMRKLGYDDIEPNSIDREESTILDKIIKLLKEDNRNIRDIANETNIPIIDLNKLIFNKYSLALICGGTNLGKELIKTDLNLT